MNMFRGLIFILLSLFFWVPAILVWHAHQIHLFLVVGGELLLLPLAMGLSWWGVRAMAGARFENTSLGKFQAEMRKEIANPHVAKPPIDQLLDQQGPWRLWAWAYLSGVVGILSFTAGPIFAFVLAYHFPGKVQFWLGPLTVGILLIYAGARWLAASFFKCPRCKISSFAKKNISRGEWAARYIKSGIGYPRKFYHLLPNETCACCGFKLKP